MQKNHSPLRDARKAKGWTLAQLSEATGLAIPSLGNYENGKRGLSAASLEKVARALETTVERISSPRANLAERRENVVSLVYTPEARRSGDSPDADAQFTAALQAVEIQLRRFKYKPHNEHPHILAAIERAARAYADFCEANYPGLPSAVAEDASRLYQTRKPEPRNEGDRT